MNQKGFITSALLYGILSLFLVLVLGTISILGNRKLANDKIELGVCGEHGGDASSIKFFNKLGIDYVSCSPYRVPSAILAAAKAAICEESI